MQSGTPAFLFSAALGGIMTVAAGVALIFFQPVSGVVVMIAGGFLVLLAIPNVRSRFGSRALRATALGLFSVMAVALVPAGCIGFGWLGYLSAPTSNQASLFAGVFLGAPAGAIISFCLAFVGIRAIWREASHRCQGCGAMVQARQGACPRCGELVGSESAGQRSGVRTHNQLSPMEEEEIVVSIAAVQWDAIRRNGWKCPDCNYDLHRAPEPRCPECGWGADTHD